MTPEEKLIKIRGILCNEHYGRHTSVLDQIETIQRIETVLFILNDEKLNKIKAICRNTPKIPTHTKLERLIDDIWKVVT